MKEEQKRKEVGDFPNPSNLEKNVRGTSDFGVTPESATKDSTEKPKPSPPIPGTSPNKDQRLYLRLSGEEKRLLLEKAQVAGLPLSKYCRLALKNSTVKVLSRDEIRNLNGIGNNFNQLVRQLNTFGVESPQNVFREFEQFFNSLKKLYQE